jgi:hypothetical protein
VTECACGNAARYVDQHGALTCAVCPIKRREDSVKLADVPRLLEWARQFVTFCDNYVHVTDDDVQAMARNLKDIVQRRPT